MREAGLSIVLSDRILAEWRAHRSSFSYGWLTSMFARRLVVRGEFLDHAPTVNAARRTLTAASAEAVAKDAHLVGAALSTDERVLSRDESVADLLATLLLDVAELAKLHWANPTETDCISWLRDGTPRGYALLSGRAPVGRSAKRKN
jgi:hypothetical protein